MMQFKNNATSRLKVGIAPADVTITVLDGDGAKFPALTGGDYFPVTLDDRRTGQIEIGICTARNGDTLTVTRAQEGTVAQAFSADTVVANRFTAGTLMDFLATAPYTKAESDAKFVDVAGDIMTGPLTLSGAPATGLHAATRDYVDSRTPIITDAPTDTNAYGRQGGTWQPVLLLTTYTASDVLAKLLTVDGADTGLDADLLDGQHAAYFAVQTDMDNVGTELTALDGRLDTVEATLPLKAPIESPAFTGNPTAPTPDSADNDTSIATTEFVQTGLATKLTDAPVDGNYYSRRNSAWVVSPGGLQDAPIDGLTYGRQSSQWVEVVLKTYVDTQLATKAPLASPVFTGDPRAPTPAPGDNDTSIATTAFVTAGIATALAPYAPLASPALTGNPTAPTQATADNSNKLATTGFVKAQGYLLAADIAGKANIASPVFTGDPQAPTPPTADNDTSIATTAFVKAQGYLTPSALTPYAPLASPVFTGNPTAPTPAVGDNDTSVATTAYVRDQIIADAITSIDVIAYAGPTSGNYAKPAGLKFLRVRLWGAGGGGAGALATGAGSGSAGAGGGGGGYVEKLFAAADLAATTAYSLAAGANGAASAATSNFGSIQVTGGTVGGNVGATATVAAICYGGAPGTGSGGDINARGEYGGNGRAIPFNVAASIGGGGGNSQIGSGGLELYSNAAGSNGAYYGAGGGGACNGQNQAFKAGGDGSPAYMVLEEYY